MGNLEDRVILQEIKTSSYVDETVKMADIQRKSEDWLVNKFYFEDKALILFYSAFQITECWKIIAPLQQNQEWRGK